MTKAELEEILGKLTKAKTAYYRLSYLEMTPDNWEILTTEYKNCVNVILALEEAFEKTGGK